MSWLVRMVPEPRTPEDYAALRVGDAWHVEGTVSTLWTAVAPRHREHLPLLVKLPCGTYFNVYGSGWKDGAPTDAAWEVVGVAPALTLKPSVSIGGGWHGFIQGGVITDDVSGKTFPRVT